MDDAEEILRDDSYKIENVPIGDFGPNALPVPTRKRREKLETRSKESVEKKIKEISEKQKAVLAKKSYKNSIEDKSKKEQESLK